MQKPTRISGAQNPGIEFIGRCLSFILLSLAARFITVILQQVDFFYFRGAGWHHISRALPFTMLYTEFTYELQNLSKKIKKIM
jgi:hypothetical protein